MNAAETLEPINVRRSFATDREILTAVGEVVYDWSIAADTIRWGVNALEVLKVASLDQISTGRNFAALLDPANPTSRQDAVLDAGGVDDGNGVAYHLRYAFLPGGPDEGSKLWIEDIGRWYADGGERPARALGVLRVINERHERELRQAFLSQYDDLTGYLSRAALIATLGDALASAVQLRTSISFLLVAVDNFQAINDAYGFDVADQILAAVADRLKSQLRSGDAIGRYSGSKLGLVLLGCDDADMHAAAERFHVAVRSEVVVTEAGVVGVTVSIGGATLPRHGGIIGEALTRVQEALGAARQHGDGHFVAYANQPERQARRRKNAAASNELVAALNDRRVRLLFRPVVDMRRRRPVFHVAATRLERPDGSAIDTREFAATAGPLGLSRLIDHRTLDLALDALTNAPDAALAIDVSAETVFDKEWIAHLSAAVAGRGDVAERLIVGMTETAAEGSLEETARFVGLLHDFGCRAAIDDFGDGFSSIRGLRILGADLVSIARVYVENLAGSREAAAFVAALADLARNLGVETIAGPVGDEKTAMILARLGIDLIWGDLAGPATATLPLSGEDGTLSAAPNAG